MTQFVLVLGWQLLEHIPSLRAAHPTHRAALVSGRSIVATLSGVCRIRALSARRATRATRRPRAMFAKPYIVQAVA